MAEQRITIYGDQRRHDRNDMLFHYRADEVRKAAADRAGHHTERAAWWDAQRAEADTELRESMQLRQRPVTGGVENVAVFDNEKQARLSECRAKVEQHQRQAEHYQAWVAAFGKMTDSQIVSLSVDDIQFFGLHGVEGEE